MDDDITACCKEIYLFVSGPADFTQFILVGAVILPLRGKSLLHMDVQWQEWGLRSHSLLLSCPLRQPSDSGLPVATPLSSSCHRGSLGSSYTVKLLPQLAPWSRPLSCGLLRSNFKLPKLYMYCTLLQRMQVVFHNLRLHFSLRHFNRTQTFTGVIYELISSTYFPGLIITSLNRSTLNVLSCWRRPVLSNIPPYLLSYT